MLAEIKGKISRSGSNLSEKLEDQLTGDFFGNLRYLPFESGMKKVLSKAKRIWGDLELATEMEQLEEQGDWHENLELWPYDIEGELDALLTIDNLVIGIEVKLESGLSSKDEEIEEEEKINTENSCNQLIRELRIVRKKAENEKMRPFLLFIAKQENCESTCKTIKERYLKPEDAENMNLYCISWEKILEILKEILCMDKISVYERVILGDLTELLMKKGFDIFKGFSLDEQKNVLKEGYFAFYKESRMNIHFDSYQEIEREIYYGFGN